MKIIYRNPDNSVGVIIPASKCDLTIEEIAAKDVPFTQDYKPNPDNEELMLPDGEPYQLDYKIVEDSEVPSDRTFRDAWEYVAGANELSSADLSLDDQLKYNQITQEEFDNAS